MRVEQIRVEWMLSLFVCACIPRYIDTLKLDFARIDESFSTALANRDLESGSKRTPALLTSLARLLSLAQVLAQVLARR